MGARECNTAIPELLPVSIAGLIPDNPRNSKGSAELAGSTPVGRKMPGLSVLITPDETSWIPNEPPTVITPHIHQLPPHSPRMSCAACGDRIVRSYVTAEEDDFHKYHQECFKCCDCGVGPDSGAIHKVDSKLYCDQHFGRRFAAKCALCKSPILPPATIISAHDSHYHESCWKCATCHSSLTDHVFLQDDSPVCEACSKAQPTANQVTLTASRAPASGRPVVVPATDWCSGCRKRIVDGKFLKALQREWHPACFRCAVCKDNLSGKAFHEKAGKPYCKTHFAMFAPKCPTCKKPVASGDFVKALDSHWHPSCFVCCRCSCQIKGSFSRKDAMPLCEACTKAAPADPALQPDSSPQVKPGKARAAPAPSARPRSAGALAVAGSGQPPVPLSARTAIQGHGTPFRPPAGERPASARLRTTMVAGGNNTGAGHEPASAGKSASRRAGESGEAKPVKAEAK